MISVAWSLTRQDHGEQPFWLGTVLAAMLGQIGLPGGGIGFGYGATNTVGLERSAPRFQPLPQADRIAGHEPVMLNPQDATARNIRNGDLVRVFNQRGACLCGAILSESIRPGVIQISTGAWFEPDADRGFCRAGNPNVLTPDKGTSRLAQGPIAHSCLVTMERYQ